MRALKCQDSLTQGSGMSRHQRAIWTMSFTVSSSFNLAIQEQTANSYTAGEQHKQLCPSRMCMNEADLVKVAAKLDNFMPFSDDNLLRHSQEEMT